MDNQVFRMHVSACTTVQEQTTSLEIYSYSEPSYNSVVEHTLSDYDFQDFLHQQGKFPAPVPRYDVHLTSQLRLVLQTEASHPDTFSPQVLSLDPQNYEAMVHAFNLPRRAIEGSSVVGPFFWSFHDQNPDDPRLHIIFRKSDTRKQGKTEGWEIILSHSFTTSTTTGFVKGTSTSHIKRAVADLRECPEQAHHPLLLPLILLSHELGPSRDKELRETRDWVRKLEQSISRRIEAQDDKPPVPKYARWQPKKVEEEESMADIEGTNRALVECHARVLRKRPQDWLEGLRAAEEAMARFRSGVPGEKWTIQLEATHASIMSRLEFYRTKLRAIEGYVHTTAERLSIQRNALASVIAHRESIVNLQMVAMITDQRRIAQASKKDGNALKRLSMMGAVFLPGTFVASLFSMSFFSNQRGLPEGQIRVDVSPQVWIYFAVTVPLTVAVVLFMWLWDRKRERRAKKETSLLDRGVQDMERDIMKQLQRQRMEDKC